MSHEEMLAMFRLGKSYNAAERDVKRVGRYGIGFKQGSMRIGSTAVVLSKSLKHNTVSLGILSNEPYKVRVIMMTPPPCSPRHVIDEWTAK